MLTKFGLTVMAAVGMLLLTGGSAAAQVVTIQSSGYIAGGGGRPATTQPTGRFSTPTYPNGDGGKWRVRVTYGTIVNGTFSPFTVGNTPGEAFSAVEDVGRGMTNKVWGISGPQNWPDGVGEQVVARAQLQRSTDGGTTWSLEEAIAQFYVR